MTTQFEARSFCKHDADEADSPYSVALRSIHANLIVHTPLVYQARFYNVAGGAGGGAVQGLSPEVTSVSVVTATRIKVNFKYPATNNEALVAPGNYKIAPTLAVHAVIPEAVTNPSYVYLDIDEQDGGVLYQLDLLRIIKA